jgi:hypothetical protein
VGHPRRRALRRQARLQDPRLDPRAGTRIPAARIAPEEYAAAVRAVLADGRALPRARLVAASRALLGFARTGPVLEEMLGRAIDALLAAGELGEASAGLQLRRAGHAAAER